MIPVGSGVPDGPTFRFAPSPNGLLHLGHAYSALLNQAFARRVGGRLLLRLEDIDPQRCREDFVMAIKEDLSWLGLAWPGPVRRQSRHLPVYAAALTGLAERGLAYPCFCGRGDIAAEAATRPGWPHDPDGAPLYPGQCRRLGAGERDRRLARGTPHLWRIDMTAALARVGSDLHWSAFERPDEGGRTVLAEPARWGDAALARKDVPTSYHLSVVIDDAAQGVSDVVRGRDLHAATGLHRLLQELLGLPAPRYHHHRLILDDAGRKLAKSRGSTSLRELRARGREARQVRADLGFA